MTLSAPLSMHHHPQMPTNPFYPGTAEAAAAAAVAPRRVPPRRQSYPPKNNPRRSRQPKRHSSTVRFPPGTPHRIIAIPTLPPSSTMSPSEKSTAWYLPREVAAFKDAIRSASAKLRLSAGQCAEDDRVAGTCRKQRKLLDHYRSRALREAARSGGAAAAARSKDFATKPTAAAAAAAAAGPDGSSHSSRRGTGSTAECCDDSDDEDGSSSPNDAQQQQEEEEEEEEDSSRGLEHRASFERQRNKFLAIRSVLAWQRKIRENKRAAAAAAAGRTEDGGGGGGGGGGDRAITVGASANFDAAAASHQLAEATSRASLYAAIVAAEAGRADFYEAYPEQRQCHQWHRLRHRHQHQQRVGSEHPPQAPKPKPAKRKSATISSSDGEDDDGDGDGDGDGDLVDPSVPPTTGDGDGNDHPRRHPGVADRESGRGRPIKRRSITREIAAGLAGVALLEEEEEE